jgi:hypothetical protein
MFIAEGLGFVVDPTGHFPLISWGRFVSDINAYKANQRALDIWVGEAHDTPQGNYLVMNRPC